MITALLIAILIVPYLFLTALDRGPLNIRIPVLLRGRMSLALLFAFTGVGHFIEPDGLALLLPMWVPFPIEIIYVTGILEIAAALGLLIPRFARLTGICLIVFLIAVFPANIYGAFGHVDLGAHSFGPVYLLIRGPMQLLFIFWTYWFAVRQE